MKTISIIDLWVESLLYFDEEKYYIMYDLKQATYVPESLKGFMYELLSYTTLYDDVFICCKKTSVTPEIGIFNRTYTQLWSTDMYHIKYTPTNKCDTYS